MASGWPPGGLGWAHTAGFRAEQHVHTHVLHPRRGNQLTSLVAELMAEPLPAGRPPWQLHAIGGLPSGEFAIVVKLHHACADALGLMSVCGPLLDDPPAEVRRAPTPASPHRRGGPGLDAVLAVPVDATRHLGRGVRGAASQVRQMGTGARIAAAVLGAARPRSVTSPLTSLWGDSPLRHWAPVRLDADELHQIRKCWGGTLHDVLLAVITGGMRDWLIGHGHGDRVASGWRIRALIPVSLRRRRAQSADTGNHLSGYLCDLPVNLSDPVAQLAATQSAMDGNKAAGPGRGPGALAVLAQQMPAGLHRVLTPSLGRAAPMLFDTVMTTVPLPAVSVHFDGAPLREVYGIAPLAAGTALSVTATIYQRGVHLGLLSDPTLLPHVDQLAKAITVATTHLHHTAG